MSDSPASAQRSNLEFWKEMQERDYFEHHPHYGGGMKELHMAEVGMIERFLPLRPDMKVAIIGCGYGRESLSIGRRVEHFYGIDVSHRILDKAITFLSERGVTNFTPILADEYVETLPEGLDLVFSIVVMQHLTKDLAHSYFRNLGRKLAPGGAFLVQFLEEFIDHRQTDAELKVYEPSVSWTTAELVALCNSAELQFGEIRTDLVTPTAAWHWVCFRRPALGSPG